MKRVIISIVVIGTAFSLSSCTTGDAAQTTGGTLYGSATTLAYDSSATPAGLASEPWPLVFITGTNTYTVFEPQCGSWDGHRLMARSAAAVQSYGQSQPTYGVFAFSTITLVDKTTRTVALANVKIISADFPSAHGQSLGASRAPCKWGPSLAAFPVSCTHATIGRGSR